MSAHRLGYSKSSRAKCHGPAPCNGTPLIINSLRYGNLVTSKYGEIVEWRHWGCVTPAILGQLAAAPVDRVEGFRDLRQADQQRIRLAVSIRRVADADIPPSAKAAQVPPTTPSQNNKRKAGDIASTPQTTAPRPTPTNAVASGSSQPRPMTSSQATEVEEDDDAVEIESADELYCNMRSNVVGVQYYPGLVGPGEEVRLVREPTNQYDRNAIQVKNIGGIQVGHLPKAVASKLASLLDRQLVTVDGIIHDGNLSGAKCYTLNLSLKIYGASDKRDSLEPLLMWATPNQRGFPPRNTGGTSAGPSSSQRPGAGPPGLPAAALSAGPSSTQQRPIPGQTPAQAAARVEAARKQKESLQKAAELKVMLNNLEKVDDESRRSSLLDTLCSVDDILELPLHPNPPGIENGQLKVNLLKHQIQALQWCIEREYPVLPKKETDKPVQFWQLRKTGSKAYFYNVATKTPQYTAPLLGRGALFADAMGKTLTMLALIVATKSEVPKDFSNSTLIVVPVSVISNWEKQIEDHCVHGSLSVCVYYGTKRSMSAKDLARHDVVITTYQSVAGEHVDRAKDESGAPAKKKKKVDASLFEVQWKRIVLDEGHTIRNPKTKIAKAVCALPAQRRWVLTGTPIINSPKDLGSILTFLQICKPLDSEEFFKRLLLRPLKDGLPSGVELLRALMNQVCIRRTKEMQDSKGNPLVPLPPVEMIVVPVALHNEARVLYDEVEALSQQRFERAINRGTFNMVQSNVLGMLTRLRQLALHPGLVPRNYLAELQALDASDNDHKAARIVVTPESKIRLQDRLALAIEDCEECPICFGILDEPRITSCNHFFCRPCITEVISRDSKCPMDRNPISLNDLHEPLAPTDPDLTQRPVRAEIDDEPEGFRSGSSAKIDQLVHLLTLTPPSEKSLVFSQFTSFLDKIGETLEERGISYVRFDGQMSAKRRQETIAQFSVPLREEAAEAAPAGNSTTGKRKRTSSSRPIAVDDDFPFPEILRTDRDDDSDFIVDDDDLSDAYDDTSSPVKPKKGKGKAKGKGKGKARSDSPDTFDRSYSGENPKVMLISLKAGALGLNLTVANNVYLMDPWWQEGIESQAVDRVNRIGQKKPVHVYQLIAENTVESKVIDIQNRKKQLIQQAFSGIKRTETQRQQKEARLQDLVELFGIRNREDRET